jgi:hypothetical protein
LYLSSPPAPFAGNQMPRFILHVNRKSPAWTEFIVHRADELPDTIREKLTKMGFEPEIGDDEENEETYLNFSLHHRGHAPHQWNIAVELMSVGFDFLNKHERDECKQGETAIMEMTFDGTAVDYNVESNNSGLTLRIYQMS